MARMPPPSRAAAPAFAAADFRAALARPPAGGTAPTLKVTDSQRASAEIDYRGFIEGDDVGKGVVDVVVTEGFAGNIALKTAEGTARQIGEYLRAAMSRTWRARLGYMLARGACRE